MAQEDPLIDVDPINLQAALCYVGVLIFIPWLIAREDPFVNWHIKQGIIVLIILAISLIASAWIMWLGNTIFLITIIADIIALTQALLGRKWKIPLIGQLAEKIQA